jgi:signal transduction histidine kinase
VSVILAVLGGLALSAGFLRRVESVNRTARQVMAGQLDSRVAVRDNGDELDRLAANLNAMLDRIQSLMESLKQVSSDIAHDLRTPLARLRQNLEAAKASATTVEEFRSSTDAAISETDSLLKTFSALLRIAQIESGARKSGFTCVELSELRDTGYMQRSRAAFRSPATGTCCFSSPPILSRTPFATPQAAPPLRFA